MHKLLLCPDQPTHKDINLTETLIHDVLVKSETLIYWFYFTPTGFQKCLLWWWKFLFILVSSGNLKANPFFKLSTVTKKTKWNENKETPIIIFVRLFQYWYTLIFASFAVSKLNCLIPSPTTYISLNAWVLRTTCDMLVKGNLGKHM